MTRFESASSKRPENSPSTMNTAPVAPMDPLADAQGELTRTFASVMGHTGGGTPPAVEFFSFWTNWELITALVERGVVIKGERNAEHRRLVGACVQEFTNENGEFIPPAKPKQSTDPLAIFTKMVAAKRIQRAWSHGHLER